MRRELLGTNIYLLPPGGPFAVMMGPGMSRDQADNEENRVAFAVAGGNLVIGRVPVVEQAIRDLRRQDVQPIQADPMYSYAARFLPAQTGAAIQALATSRIKPIIPIFLSFEPMMLTSFAKGCWV